MRTRHLLIGFVLGVAVAVSAVAVAATSRRGPVEYKAASGERFNGLRPTAVGLPQTGAPGTVGAKELPTELARYHDSGDYARDLRVQVAEARRYLVGRLSLKGRRKVRRPAVVLDIDETSLSNYKGLAAAGFGAAGTVGQIAGGTGEPIAPTVALARTARVRGVAVFFVTGRPEGVRAVTERNLRAAGYDGWSGLQFKPSGTTTEAYKAGARRAIERRGFTIVANLGDQESDLDGGYADRAFKLPNPFYFIPD